jgi:hypothetical protein
MVATLLARNTKEAMVAPIVGVCRCLRLAGICSLESDGPFCVGAIFRNLALAAVKMFTFNSCYKDIL